MWEILYTESEWKTLIQIGLHTMLMDDTTSRFAASSALMCLRNHGCTVEFGNIQIYQLANEINTRAWDS